MSLSLFLSLARSLARSLSLSLDEVGSGVVVAIVVDVGGPEPPHSAVLAVMSSQLHTPSESSSLRQSGVSEQQ